MKAFGEFNIDLTLQRVNKLAILPDPDIPIDVDVILNDCNSVSVFSIKYFANSCI